MLGNSGNFNNGAFGSQIAVQHAQARFLHHRIVQRTNDVAVVHHGVFYVFAHRVAVDRHAVAVQAGQQVLHQGRHAAGQIKVLHRVFAARHQVGQQRHGVAHFIENSPPGLVITGFLRDGGKMQDQVGGTGHSHIHGDGVADGFGGDDLPGGHAFAYHFHNPLAGVISQIADLAGNSAHGRVAGQRHAHSLSHHAHGIGGGHGRAAAADSPAMLNQAVIQFRIDLSLGHCAHLVLRADVNHFLAAEGAQRHITAGDNDGGNVQTGAAHQMAGHDGVAGGQKHHAVEEVAVHGQLHLIGDGITGGNLDIFGILQHHAVADGGGHHFQRQAARFADTLLDALGQLVQMHMAGIVFIPGVYHGDQRTVQFFFAVAHAQHQAPAALGRFAKLPAASHFFVLFHFCFLLLHFCIVIASVWCMESFVSFRKCQNSSSSILSIAPSMDWPPSM